MIWIIIYFYTYPIFLWISLLPLFVRETAPPKLKTVDTITFNFQFPANNNIENWSFIYIGFQFFFRKKKTPSRLKGSIGVSTIYFYYDQYWTYNDTNKRKPVKLCFSHTSLRISFQKYQGNRYPLHNQ